jgi:hypothetical protein
MSIRGLGIIIAGILCAAMLAATGCGGDTTIIVMPGGDLARQGEQAMDGLAKSVVRNAMTVLESAYIDIVTFDPETMTPEVLQLIEPSLVFNVAASPEAASADPQSESSPGDSAVDYYGTETTYAVGSRSDSGHTFGVTVDKGINGGYWFYVNGAPAAW